jgi:hypothetical protein
MKKPDAESTESILRRMGSAPFDLPHGLFERAFSKIAPELARRRSRQRSVFTRVALAGALSLPVLLGLNAATLWLLASGLSLWLPAPLVEGFTFVLGALMLLALSLTYGSLPILASLACRLREETP